MYHILRKQGPTVARPSEEPGRRKRSGAIRPRVGNRGLPSKLPNKSAARSNIDRWFETVFTTEPNLPTAAAQRKQKDQDQNAQRRCPPTQRLKKTSRQLGCGNTYIVSARLGS
ncbi:hypothetical protein PENNAL_c0189G05494 [Penicillium nalgiovense]|uniref:Uncharacterized protein n=1 Tax=Penicillium nalgiovense TaxID=60175 RepID=A0A1V6WU04_PENNA|nr:hypothetical protein PENNAL_c0189G05494 [Penicillium nalgiovense]